MAHTPINSKSAPKAVGGYSQALLTKSITQRLYISGQIPEDIDGHVADNFTDQAHQVWRNILDQLDAAYMSIDEIAKVTIFLSDRRYSEENSNVRRHYLGSHAAALTVVIAEIFDPAWLLEIEVIAEK